MAKVQLWGITRQYDGAIAIEDITFEVPDGEFWVLVGPSGCGKSTILRTIAGLEAATSGDLYIGDRLVNQIPARQRDVAMVFQNYALYPHMSVAENLAFGLQMRKANSKTIRERVETVARMLNIEHLLERKPRQLSGGQQQRVALGRAIARQPQVFLLDEPLSNLDAQLRDDTRAELKQLHQQVGITTIYVTHDQIEAMTLADQIVVLNQGRIQQIGTPQTIYNYPANRMVATFLGNPSMNILQAMYDGSAFQVNGQSLSCPEPIKTRLQPDQGQWFDLGIRPEHIKIGSEGSFLNVEAIVVEPLGRETLVRTVLPGQDNFRQQVLNIQVEAERQIHLGDRLPLQLNFEHLFVFNPTTGETLYPAG
ncbi:ABC transporter ATP-binding protein [Leptothermofonsia sp. ETS-13]|uniref:ABC transporter ATP-binding protein n=1 Tax=Leptothermofonsia sp. ETS-13 TaxID=3035696 RepID=UPI003BA35E23